MKQITQKIRYEMHEQMQANLALEASSVRSVVYQAFNKNFYPVTEIIWTSVAGYFLDIFTE